MAEAERPHGWSLENDDDEEEEASPLPSGAAKAQAAQTQALSASGVRQGAPSPPQPSSLSSSTTSISRTLHAIPASAPINAPPAPEPEIDPLDAFMMGITADVKEIEKKDARLNKTPQAKAAGTGAKAYSHVHLLHSVYPRHTSYFTDTHAALCL